MKIIPSPLSDPDKWIRCPTYYLHVRMVGDRPVPRIEHRKDKFFWIADVDSYSLREFYGADRIFCYSYRYFGMPAVMQYWGFDADIAVNKGQRAVCFGGSWYLVEPGDEFAIVSAEEQPPFELIDITLDGWLDGRETHKSVAIYKK